MSWKPIVVGVDASSEAARAASLGAALATAASTACHLIHAARDPWTVLPRGEIPLGPGDMVEESFTQAREAVLHALWGQVPPGVLGRLAVRSGQTPVVLRQAAAEFGAELIVVGGKHHATVAEWFGRSTALHLIRTAEPPVLVTTRAGLPRRVFVAVDGSDASAGTLKMAERYAALFGAALKVVSIIEPPPTLGDAPVIYDPQPYYRAAEAFVVEEVWPLIETKGVEREIFFGMVADTIEREARRWGADLVVVGSHGKGWVERALLGSVTQRLVHDLPASVLVVPAHVALAAAPVRVRAVEALGVA